MAVHEQAITVEAFHELSHQPEYADKQLELVDGELIVMSPSSERNSKIAALIAHYILSFVLCP